MNYWLMKCEPEVFSIDDLQQVTRTGWEGVRNYQARNFMKTMAVGDLAFFYHSNATPSGISGLMTISKAAVPDPFQFENGHKYFEPRATLDTPVWVTVEVTFKRRFKQVISLADLKSIQGLDGMEVLKRGSRLSIQPVRPHEFELIVKWESQRQ
jgi:predicted RNA-binding protein with PUA-like domain